MKERGEPGEPVMELLVNWAEGALELIRRRGVLKGPIICERRVLLPSIQKEGWDLLCVALILKPIRPMLYGIFNNQMAMAEGSRLAKTK